MQGKSEHQWDFESYCTWSLKFGPVAKEQWITQVAELIDDSGTSEWSKTLQTGEFWRAIRHSEAGLHACLLIAIEPDSGDCLLSYTVGIPVENPNENENCSANLNQHDDFRL